nr:hypothetical protein [Microbacterium arborescens]
MSNLRTLRDERVVRDQDHRGPPRVKFREEVDDRVGGIPVEGARRLIREDDVGPIHERAADPHALALTAGKRSRLRVSHMPDAQSFEQIVDPPTGFARRRSASGERGQKDVLAHRQFVEELGMLEDEAHAFPPKSGRATVIDPSQRDAVEDHLAAVGPVEAT